ncbi:hypothetical protein DESPIG_02865 [Desulfovibrio piger ATCC 29098]|uniref:Uncharacterized protein n=1 Tax=Desulfovibrio piger ATCC 29098 TaxID=411464 RepID=B6WXN8_9BACT|nr:hypothetical protein DESPIG_02865 [Desulfovibrio piger ATCC 29098]
MTGRALPDAYDEKRRILGSAFSRSAVCRSCRAIWFRQDDARGQDDVSVLPPSRRRARPETAFSGGCPSRG